MTRRTPQEQGRDYEEELAARYGGRAQPNSGAGPRWKLDWKRGSLLFSAKHTVHRSFRLTAEDLHEVRAGSQGPGGRGERGVMVVRMGGFPDDVFVVPGEVMRELLAGDPEVQSSAEPSRRAQKLAAAARR
jgi:hypothetical protein